MDTQVGMTDNFRQGVGQSCLEYATLISRDMSLLVQLAKANDYTDDEFDVYSTDRKKSKVIIKGLRADTRHALATICAAKANRSKWDMCILGVLTFTATATAK